MVSQNCVVCACNVVRRGFGRKMGAVGQILTFKEHQITCAQCYTVELTEVGAYEAYAEAKAGFLGAGWRWKKQEGFICPKCAGTETEIKPDPRSNTIQWFTPGSDAGKEPCKKCSRYYRVNNDGSLRQHDCRKFV